MGGHRSNMPEQINESEEVYSEYTKADPILEEAYDSMQEIYEAEQANAAESNAGFQSHRHLLGQKHTIIKPTLMADQEIKHKNSNFQLQELRRKIVMSQENSGLATAV